MVILFELKTLEKYYLNVSAFSLSCTMLLLDFLIEIKFVFVIKCFLVVFHKEDYISDSMFNEVF